MTDIRALIERLKQCTGSYDLEAAEALETLAARVEELQSTVQKLVRLPDTEQEVEALEPQTDAGRVLDLLCAIREHEIVCVKVESLRAFKAERDALLIKADRISGALSDAVNVPADFEYAEEAIRKLTSERDTLRAELADRTLANTQLAEQAQKMYDERERLAARVEELEGTSENMIRVNADDWRSVMAERDALRARLKQIELRCGELCFEDD